ncbi:hypothetical protein ANN_17951 [Periplaneta americana]|uniref:Uncharacterized protein n=1 Tax=Periplaneta americana TaxID=6978 RepID=A0ABQ8SMF6_PERAM|nr:hypothetical protein ANN_17951 [Periplaneta americana]
MEYSLLSRDQQRMLGSNPPYLEREHCLPNKAFSTTRCRQPGCNEIETLGHVLGFCRKGELLRNNRHHRVRGAIACLLRNNGWEVHEEVHCISEDDPHRRADLIAINRQQQKAIIIDPTIRMERDLNQAHQVDQEKRAIYEPCIPYLSAKYNIPLFNCLWNSYVISTVKKFHLEHHYKTYLYGNVIVVNHEALLNDFRNDGFGTEVSLFNPALYHDYIMYYLRSPLRRPRRRWEDNIKMDLREVKYDGRNWIRPNIAQDRDR